MAQQSVLTLADVAKASILAFNEKNWDKVRNTLAPGFVYEEVGTGRRVQGVDDVLNIWRGWAAAMPDVKGTVVNEYVSGTTVVLELTWVGTHTGPLQTPNGTIPATGKRLNLNACEIVETKNDKLTAARHYFDMATILNQLGVLSK